MLDGSAAVTEMFNKAIKGELMSIELYLQLSETQKDPDLKDFFIRMAKEELGHKKALEGMGLEVFGMNFGDDDEVETLDDYKPRPLKEIELNAENVKFNPETIEVDEGVKLILKMKGVDKSYGIVCPTYAIKEYLTQGELVIAEIFPDQPGEFEFFNNVPAGSGWKDMRGRIVVKETEEGKLKRTKKKDDDPLG
ncbi:TPA: hypothetical protein HA265_04515 [Candidatus Woesearchaeota archaeon]|nr:hypothetical protein [Candidatus Woesearchaeota archaeon]